MANMIKLPESLAQLSSLDGSRRIRASATDMNKSLSMDEIKRDEAIVLEDGWKVRVTTGGQDVLTGELVHQSDHVWQAKKLTGSVGRVLADQATSETEAAELVYQYILDASAWMTFEE